MGLGEAKGKTRIPICFQNQQKGLHLSERRNFDHVTPKATAVALGLHTELHRHRC